MPDHPPAAAHILSFAQTLKGGGVERAMLRMADGWARAGRRVTLVIGDSGGALAHEIPDGVAVRELGSTAYRALFGLPGIVRELAPDIVFCPGNHYTGAAFWLRTRLGRACPPIVGKISNALVRPDLRRGAGAGYRGWLRMHPRFLDAVVAMTPAMAGEAVGAMGLAPTQVHVIPNPPAQPIADAPPPVLPEGRFLLGVGRLAPQKRWERLITAMPRLRDPEVKLVILGEGEEREALERLVARLGLGDRVSMPGHAPDPLPAIERAAAVVLTSEFEGVPGVLREAIALGTPAIATDSSVAIHELIDSSARGTIVPPGDRARLVGALNYWLMPGRKRPEPRPETGPDPVEAYLDLFDMLVAQRGR
ncbi:glycosyltransferase [Sphingomonas sp. BT-65]|uniref:glycosyltransferase n=1 Tax=Sphingomonas sp. BT-65 TaxID=2989821 RepID=UPI0022356BF8|nr:glycosyltransferase [Sphingomonas sp. BT-65]MCW4462564.1 glycosyltransferase [Sphingomonas sp. BT-65]